MTGTVMTVGGERTSIAARDFLPFSKHCDVLVARLEALFPWCLRALQLKRRTFFYAFAWRGAVTTRP